MDAKKKTETELTFWYVLPYFVHSKSFQSKQRQKQVCSIHIWICNLWHLGQKVTKSVLLKKPKKTRACDRGHKFEIEHFVNEVTNSKLWHFVACTGMSRFKGRRGLRPKGVWGWLLSRTIPHKYLRSHESEARLILAASAERWEPSVLRLYQCGRLGQGTLVNLARHYIQGKI